MNSFHDTLTAAVASDLSSPVGSGQQRVVNSVSIFCDLQRTEYQPVQYETDGYSGDAFVNINGEHFWFHCAAADWPATSLKPSPGSWNAPGTKLTIDGEQYYTVAVEGDNEAIDLILQKHTS